MPEPIRTLEGRTVEKLERELAVAITAVMEQFVEELPIFPNQHTIHFMSKAAVTVLEAATPPSPSKGS